MSFSTKSTTLTVEQIFQSKSLLRNIYVHLPFCLKKCHFCAFPVHIIGSNNNRQLLKTYLDTLLREIQVSKRYNFVADALESLYFGGGTPSLYHANDVSKVIQGIGEGRRIQQITLQANPSQLEIVQQFSAIGINRISLGLQTFNSQSLKKYNRQEEHQGTLYERVVQQLSLHRPSNLSVDFIVEMMPQPSDVERMLQFIAQIMPQHVTIYLMEVNEGSYLFKHCSEARFVTHTQTTVDHYIAISERLSELGYEHYQISNFSKDGGKYRSKHTQIYWSGNKEYAAYGLGATSLIAGNRITRPSSLAKYYRFVEEIQSAKQGKISCIDVHQEQTVQLKIQTLLLSGIRRKEGISWKQLMEVTQELDFRTPIMKELDKIEIQRQGIIDWETISEGIRLHRPLGYLFADEVTFRLITAILK